MPSLQPIQLVDAVLSAIEESGESGILVSGIRSHPREFAVTGPDGTYSLWIYMWTLTPGGRPQLRNEYRIQMTAVQSPLTLNSDGITALIGYEPNLKMFAGFDINIHRTFTAGSPSVQVNIETLHEALQNGLAFRRKENQEITVAIRPDQFISYIRSQNDFHGSVKHNKTFNMVKQAASHVEIDLPELKKLSPNRQRVVHTVNRISRDASFRKQVLNAYDNRCAVTRMQLKLVEAAHILPITDPKSVDDVRNGIALSPTYHVAFDRGLIYLDKDYVMKVNYARRDKLISMRLDAGLDDFISSLGKIQLPHDKRQWPHIRFISKANNLRRITSN